MDIIGMIKEASAAVKTIGGVVDDLHLSKEEKLNFHTLLSQLMVRLHELVTAVTAMQAKIITAEAQSDSWLAKNWRPIAMLTFLYIVIHTIILVPLFNLPSVSQAVKDVPAKIWDLLTYGLGGYVIGRSVEKTIDKISLGSILRNKKKNQED